MAETEVSNEVSKMVAIEEKCVLDMSSYQDLPKPDCNGTNHRNQANDLDNSYVFVSGSDGVTEDVANEDVKAEDSKVMLERDAAGVKDQGAELHSHIDALSGGIKPPNEAEGIIERSNDEPPLNEANSIIERGNGDFADNKDVDAEDLSVLPESSAAGVEDQEADLHSQIGKIDIGDPPVLNVDNKDVEAEVLSVLPEPDTAVVKDQGEELHSQIEKEDADSVEFQLLNEAENSITVRSNGDLSLANFDSKVVEAEGLSVLPDSDAADIKDQGAELHPQIDAVNVNFHPLNEAENSIIGDPPLVNVNNEDVVEDEGSSVMPDSDAAGVKDQGAESHSQIDAVNVNFHPLNEAENSITGDPPLINADNEDVVEDEGSNVLPESDAGMKDQEAGLHSQIENIDGVSQPLNGTENYVVEQNNWESPLLNVENKDAEGLSVPQECDSAGEQVAELDPQSFLNIDNKDVETKGSSVVFQHNAAEIKDQGEELGSQNESFDAVESRNVEQIKEDPTSKHESFLENDEGVQVYLDDPLVEHAGETKTETEVKDVQDSDGKTESLTEAEVEKALEQNGIVEDAAEGKEEKLDDASKSVSSQIPVENQVSQVVALGLVAEPGENMESNNILLHVDNSLNANDKCEDQSNLCLTEALEVHHESQDVIQHELQDVTVDIDNEVKSVREVLEPMEALDEEANTTLSSEVLENQQDETAFGNNVQGVLGQMNESKTVGSSTDSHVQTVCNLVVEEQNENFCVSEVDSGVQYPEDTKEQPDSNGVSHDTIPSETKTEASMQAQSYPVSDAHAPESEISNAETVGTAPIIPISEVTENLSPSDDSGIRCPDEVVLTEKEAASQGDEAHAETEVSSGKAEAAVNKEVANIMLDIESTEDIRDQLDDTIDSGNENLLVQENEDTVNPQCSKVSVASAEGSSVNTSDGQEQSVKIKTKPFNFLIRVPRFDDENLREQIRIAKIHVDEKTKLRDAVQIQIQEKRANSQVHGIDYEYAKSEARSVRKLVRSKRMEIDSLQSVINKAKNASSIEDIDSQIYNMEHMIQHETLPLKEEKQLIREIKQLKQLREQLSSNMGSQDEIKQAIEQRGQVEERLKILRKELDVLKNRVLNAEATATEAGKRYDDENKKVKELQAQFRAADDVRQAAYAQWQNLRKELSKKSEYFFKYKDDAAVASNYAYSRDTEALYLLCTNQVDNFMQLWNTNEEFRREYAKFNTRSTVRRFGTLDGRALGPDEVAPRLPSFADERVSRMASTSVKVDLASRVPSPEVKQETRNENTAVDNKAMKKVTESNYHKVTKEAAISVQANGFDDTHSVEVYKEAIRSKEEIESLRREEEKKREEVEAKLKEQRRVEALAKANEARERKKRQAEKLQMRADLKTQKEAEQREKEREKRLRKKERKKGGVTTDGNDMKSMNCESGPSSESAAESSKDIDVVVNDTVSKKQQAQKPWLGKQSKGKSIPPPLRNRNKKKLQQWMWVGVTSVMILVLFWLGNIGVFSNVALKRRGPVL